MDSLGFAVKFIVYLVVLLCTVRKNAVSSCWINKGSLLQFNRSQKFFTKSRPELMKLEWWLHKKLVYLRQNISTRWKPQFFLCVNCFCFFLFLKQFFATNKTLSFWLWNEFLATSETSLWLFVNAMTTKRSCKEYGLLFRHLKGRDGREGKREKERKGGRQTICA